MPAACAHAAALTIDGRPDEPQWADARVYRDFVVTQPYTLGAPQLPTEARVLATPEGLAVAFICTHPPDVPRTRTILARDADRLDSDAVLLMVDFEGSGNVGYEFAVALSGTYRDATITNETQFNNDWDGLWERAVHEEEGRWSVEILLPWSIATMRKAQGPTRTIGIYLSRYLYVTAERSAIPATHFERERFVSEFARLEVPRYDQSVFDVWPYATALSDLVNDDSEFKAGLDVFWKPSGSFMLAATLNPDFGQVESDDLVIDFSAIETFFSDKRPFFTENQGIFDLRTPTDGYLIYTRRIGGPNDVDGAASDIDGAAKIIGAAAGLDYGVLAAQEADEFGRTFAAARVNLPRERWAVGYLGTWAERPTLDRTALVHTLDYDFKPNEHWRVRGQLNESRIEELGEEAKGRGGWTRLDYRHSDRWNYVLELLRYDERIDFNDLGYLQRNDLEELFANATFQRTDFAPEAATSAIWWELETAQARNTAHTDLVDEWELKRTQEYRGGSLNYLELLYETAGFDDLLSRGNGDVYLEPRWSLFDMQQTPRYAHWRGSFGVWAFQQGVEDWALQLEPTVTWYATEQLNFDLDVWPRWSEDWLLWLEGDRLASFSQRQLSVDLSANWFPAPRHEVRLRAQWLTIDARATQVYQIGEGGRLVPVDETTEDFAVANFGVQLRYRYEIAPLSDVYVVYSRGGLEFIDSPRESGMDLFQRATELRDADQVLLKVRYRF